MSPSLPLHLFLLFLLRFLGFFSYFGMKRKLVSAVELPVAFHVVVVVVDGHFVFRAHRGSLTSSISLSLLLCSVSIRSERSFIAVSTAPSCLFFHFFWSVGLKFWGVFFLSLLCLADRGPPSTTKKKRRFTIRQTGPDPSANQRRS